MSQVVIGTAGHIDHGKTALVKALTGTDTDRLAEEKVRGMTIDLGFAYLNPEVTIIDVPGHEKFIRNMVAGVATIHIALLIVAADDGVMPQTREHLHILNLLGISRGLIAITKTDLVDDPEWLDLVELDVREMVKGTFLAEALILRTSVNPERGIEALRDRLIAEAEKVQRSGDRGFFRLPVDRVFSKKGFGLVVTGTVLSGAAKPGNELELLPERKRVKVRGIQSHGLAVELVTKGDRAALNLVSADKDALRRGVELTAPDWIQPTDKIIAEVTLIPDSPWKLKNRQRLHLHLGTTVVLARVQMPNRQSLNAGECGNVIFNLEKSLPAAMDDRFIIRSYSPMVTMGGCIILDPLPGLKGKRLNEWTRILKRDPKKRFKQFVQQSSSKPSTIKEWAHVFHQSDDWIKQVLESIGCLVSEGLVFFSGTLEISKRNVLQSLQDFHYRNPYQKSIPAERLEHATGYSVRWLQFILNRLEKESIIKPVIGGYALSEHEVKLSVKDQNLAKMMESSLGAIGFNLSTADIIGDTLHQPSQKILEVLHVLKEQGIVIEVSSGKWLLKKRLEELILKLKTFFESQDQMTVAAFKVLTNTTRKASIPLLEYCDRLEYTQRQGDQRVKGTALI
ncbi:MAG: selenocysteine-specific translation elongation factor [Fidelibacterota bacterium]